MDPLSITASTLALAQVLALGIKRLQRIANSSLEFCDMVNDLSTLRGLLELLQATMKNHDSISTDNQPLVISADTVRSLEAIRVELELVVSGMNDIESRLSGAGGTRDQTKRRKVSKLAWQRNRKNVLRLRERSRRCREELSACIGLLGFSQRLAPQTT